MRCKPEPGQKKERRAGAAMGRKITGDGTSHQGRPDTPPLPPPPPPTPPPPPAPPPQQGNRPAAGSRNGSQRAPRPIHPSPSDPHASDTHASDTHASDTGASDTGARHREKPDRRTRTGLSWLDR